MARGICHQGGAEGDEKGEVMRWPALFVVALMPVIGLPNDERPPVEPVKSETPNHLLFDGDTYQDALPGKPVSRTTQKKHRAKKVGIKTKRRSQP